MIVALIPSKEPSLILPSANDLQLNVNFSATLGVSAEQAKRIVTRCLLDEISLFIGPESPLLIIQEQGQLYWRFPLTLMLETLGKLGMVGELDVDAYTGKLFLNDHKI